MKLLDKIKNTFFEEEYVEVEEKTKAVAKKIEAKEKKKDSIKKKLEKKVEEPQEELMEEPVVEEVPKEKLETIENSTINYSDNELAKDTTLPYFDEEDFIDKELISDQTREPKKLYGESADKLYSTINYDYVVSNQPYGANTRGAFKPTPIISPIYGILDKNYKKEEVIDKKDMENPTNKQDIDLDAIRRKAYGKEEPVVEEEEIEESAESEGLLYDMTNENATPAVDKVTIADAEEYFEDLGLEYNVDYKDSRYEKATGRRAQIEKEDLDTEIEEKQDDEEATLEDNLFDIIDSMYDEEDKEVEE